MCVREADQFASKRSTSSGGMTFESNQLKHSSAVRLRHDFGGTIGTSEGPDHETLYACTFLSPGSQQSGSGIGNLSTTRRATYARTSPRCHGAEGNDTGGQDERLREHRIGH